MKFVIGLIIAFLCSNSYSQVIKVFHQFGPAATHAVVLNRFAEPLSAELKRPVVFESHNGAGGIMLMTNYQNRGDSNTFLFAGTSPYTVIPLAEKVPYNTDDLEPLALITVAPLCYTTNNIVKEKDFRKFIEENKGKFFGSLGSSTIEYLSIDNMNRKESMGMTSVNYKNYGEIQLALSRNDIQLSIVPANLCHYPVTNVPATYAASYWFGLFGKKSVDKKILDTFADAFVSTWLKNKEEYSKSVNYAPKHLRGEEFKAFIETDKKKWESFLKAVK
jgi:tripartite-type tricarboxylate transporter receptor subunit TctC